MLSRLLFVLAALATSVPAQQIDTGLDRARTPAEAALVGLADFAADRLIVGAAEGADAALLATALDAARYELVEPLMPAAGLYLVRLVDGTRVPDAITALAGHPALRYAAPDHVVTQRSTTPNDPSYGQQWCHGKMQSALAWDLGQGSQDFVVSVVDGGCMLTHADLTANLFTNAAESAGAPGVDDDANGYVDDVKGWNAYANNGSVPNDSHGTHVNGIVGARGNNALGVAGVNWNVRLLPVAGSSGTTSTVVKAYNYALAMKTLWLSSGGLLGANVVSTNSSFGVDYGNCASATYKPWNDSYDALGAAGVLSCAATMNINANVDATGDVPTGCSSAWLVTVTNTTSTDTKNSGAAYGATTIDLGAPGTNVYSTYSNGGYTNMTGTSMASPQAAGAIALLHSVASAEFAALRAADPAQAALELKQVLLDNVDVLPDLNGKTVSGGRLNLSKAATAIAAWSQGGSPGVIEPYGVGLGGANIGTLASDSIPNIGTTLVLQAGGFVNSTSAILVIATVRDTVPYAGGTMLVNLSTILALVPFPVAGGAATLNLPIPANPALVGFFTAMQCGAADALLPQGIALSNGLKVTLGN